MFDLEQNPSTYIYQNFHDLCLGRSIPPLKLRNQITIGQHYLIPCVKLCKQTKEEEEDLELFAHNVFEQITIIENTVSNGIKDLLVQIEIQNPKLLSEMLELIILPVSKHIQSWPNNLKFRASLAVHIHYNINLSDPANFDKDIKTLVHIYNEICASGVDILWFSLESLPREYLIALEKLNFRQALQIFYDYYEKCAVFAYSLFSLCKNSVSTLALKTPSWMIPESLPPEVAKIYRPLVILLGSKLLSIPSLCKKPNCLTFCHGAGAIAKAMTGAPLMVPNLFEINLDIGNRALALADIVSTQLSNRIQGPNNTVLDLFKATQQYINYFNFLHKKDGYAANQETRNVLMQSIPDLTPLHLLIDYPRICEISKQLLVAHLDFPQFLKIVHQIIQLFCLATEQKTLHLSKEEHAILLHCKQEFVD